MKGFEVEIEKIILQSYKDEADFFRLIAHAEKN